MATPKFSENEKVYAFDGPWIYSASILCIHYDRDTSVQKYQIHYRDWPDCDEYVTSERLLKITSETKEIKKKMDAQSEIILLDDSTRADQILAVEGKAKKFHKGDIVHIFSEWLLYKGYVIDVEFAHGLWKYCIRYMFRNIKYEEWIKSGERRVTDIIREYWVTSDRLFKNTDVCVSINKKLKKYRTLEDEDIIQEYLQNKQKICKIEKENDVAHDNTKNECIDIDASHISLDASDISVFHSGSGSDTFTNSRPQPLQGRLPRQSNFARNIKHNSTRMM